MNDVYYENPSMNVFTHLNFKLDEQTNKLYNIQVLKHSQFDLKTSYNTKYKQQRVAEEKERFVEVNYKL